LARKAQLGKAIISTASVQAPTGGLNARDALADMPESDASILENWFPKPSSVDIRNGSENYATGLPGWVETLAFYHSPSAENLFAASGSGIYDVTAGGAVGAASVTGLASVRFQHVNITTPGGSYLYMVNGVDKPQLYTGSAWVAVDGASTPAITGVTTTNLVHVNLFKNRLWFVEKDTFKIWYLPVDSVGGAANSINFGSLFKLGGSLNCMVNWTINNANGIDDYAAFISTEGEIALYKGTDPSSSTTWALVGMFRIGRPVGRRCYAKVNSDVVIICADGAYPISQAVLVDRQSDQSISYKIQNLINTDVQNYSSHFGWQPILYPIGNKLIINVPKEENSIQYQYVMNTINGSWAKFTGWNAACWEIYNDMIMYGGDQVVVKADTGTDDNGNAINTDVKTAFTYFKQRGRIKRVTMARAIFYATAIFYPSIELNIDYEDRIPTAPQNFSSSTTSLWDVSAWDVTPWGSAYQILKSWQTVNGVGTAISLRIKSSTIGIAAQWQAVDYAYETGGVF